MRHPGGVSDDFRPGGMSYATRRKGGRLLAQGRESHVAFFLGRIPQVDESLEREMGLVGGMDMEAWVSGFNGYAKE